jgi:hypothetical protein
MHARAAISIHYCQSSSDAATDLVMWTEAALFQSLSLVGPCELQYARVAAHALIGLNVFTFAPLIFLLEQMARCLFLLNSFSFRFWVV